MMPELCTIKVGSQWGRLCDASSTKQPAQLTCFARIRGVLTRKIFSHGMNECCCRLTDSGRVGRDRRVGRTQREVSLSILQAAEAVGLARLKELRKCSGPHG